MAGLVFKGSCPQDYVKAGWEGTGRVKAAIHFRNGTVLGYRRLKDLKEANPEFRHLKKCHVDIRGFLHRIYIKKEVMVRR